jgi:ribosomal protein S24E
MTVKLELTSTRINKVVGRKELAFRVEEASTPSRADVRREIAVLMRTDPDNVYVRSLETRTGTRTVTGLAHVYDDAKKAEGVEPKYIITRNRGKPKEDEKIVEASSAVPAPEEEKK